MKVVSGVFILKDDGSALLQHRDDKPEIRHPGLWTIPGGHRNPGEKLEDCARREVFEETSYRCDQLKLIDDFICNDGIGDDYRIALYWTTYDNNQKYECLEGQDLKFVKRQDVSQYAVLQFILPYWDRALNEMNLTRD
ncbi:MAG: NUDIX domain-containing protein [Oligoflexia bacterium]|nr:NUDIX domain-containing protein [Oligoflexia bacterium]